MPGIDAYVCHPSIHLVWWTSNGTQIQLIVDEFTYKLNDWLRCKNGIRHRYGGKGCYRLSSSFSFAASSILSGVQIFNANHSSLDCRAIKCVLVFTEKYSYTLCKRPFIKFILFWIDLKIHLRMAFREQCETARKKTLVFVLNRVCVYVQRTHSIKDYSKTKTKPQKLRKYQNIDQKWMTKIEHDLADKIGFQNLLYHEYWIKWCFSGLCGRYCWLFWWRWFGWGNFLRDGSRDENIWVHTSASRFR